MDYQRIITEVKELRVLATNLRDSLRFARNAEVSEVWEQIRAVDARIESRVGEVKSHIRETLPNYWEGKMPRHTDHSVPRLVYAKTEELYKAGEVLLGWHDVLPKLNEAAYGYPVWS